ncbi:hypothetical protein SSPNP10_03275 [Streptomyces sp. NP10]|nr:hypothetical protein SSPNP10_03275 [Streptomyces sp. NP10]
MRFPSGRCRSPAFGDMEDGRTPYRLRRKARDPCGHTLIERGESWERLDAHGRTPHRIPFGSTVNGCLESE